MKRLEGIIATHVDRHGDKFTVEALHSMVQQMQKAYLPMGIEHDPRVPPIGRMISATVTKLENGEYGVKGVWEIFDGQGSLELGDDEREIPLRTYRTDKLELIFDRTYSSVESQAAIKELADILKTNPQEEFKKCLDPLSVITMGGAFVLGGIAIGFLHKLGADTYDVIKSKLSKVLSTVPVKEKLLVIECQVIEVKDSFHLQVILENPTDSDLESLMRDGLHQLDEITSRYWKPSIGIKKLVCVYENNEVQLRFGIRKDAVPLAPKLFDKPKDSSIKRKAKKSSTKKRQAPRATNPGSHHGGGEGN